LRGAAASRGLPREPLNSAACRTDIALVSEHPQPPGSPTRHDRLEIVDQSRATRIGAIVESADSGHFVLRLEQATRLPEEALVRWFDGSTAWQAMARLEHTDSSSVSCHIEPPHAWQPTPVRRSQRAVAGSGLLARIVSSSVLPGGRRVHTVCLDLSATGCRATWPGRTPQLGDTVDLTWDVGHSSGAIELGWVAARVARIIPLASGEREVCFSFVVTKATQAARIRAWHRAWLKQHGVREDDAA
jgi:hypothetical protein